MKKEGKKAGISGGAVPMGTIVAFALNVNSIPNGWLLCDGSTIPDKYQELITALGNNQTPNLGGRTLVGTGKPDSAPQSDGTSPNFDAGNIFPLGWTAGEYQHQLVVSEMPKHQHPLLYEFDLNSGCHAGTGSTPCASGTIQYTDFVGGDGFHNTMQPYQAVNFIIYTGHS